MKVSIFIFLMTVCASSSFGQFSVENYLSAPFQEAELEGLVKQLEYMNTESFRSPLFRELEIRLRSNDFNLSPEDFRLRLGFINPFERKANKSFNEKHADYVELKYNYEVNLIIANRYKQLISHYYLVEAKEQLNLEIDRLKISYEQLQTQKFSLKLLIETDEQMLKKELRKKEIQSSIDILENYIYKIHRITDSISWAGVSMITVEQIRNRMKLDTTYRSFAFDLAFKSFKMDEQAFKIKKAESFRNIGFFQAEYDTDRGKDFNSHLGFQLGISLPIFNPDKPDLQRENLELLESEYELKQIRNEAEIKRFNLNKKLLETIWSYEVVNKRIADFEAFGQEITYDNMEDFLTLTEYLGSLNRLKSEYYMECLNLYIDLLAHAGKLSASPLFNYISNE